MCFFDDWIDGGGLISVGNISKMRSPSFPRQKHTKNQFGNQLDSESNMNRLSRLSWVWASALSGYQGNSAQLTGAAGSDKPTRAAHRGSPSSPRVFAPFGHQHVYEVHNLLETPIIHLGTFLGVNNYHFNAFRVPIKKCYRDLFNDYFIACRHVCLFHPHRY